MRYQRLVVCAFSSAILALIATAAQAVVIGFDSTGTMNATQGGGYNNVLSAHASGYGAAGDSSATMVGNYSLDLQGSYNSANNTVSVAGASFIKKSGQGQLTTSPPNLNMNIGYSTWFGWVNVGTASVNNLLVDFDSQGIVTPISGSGFTTPSGTLTWVNGGTVHANGAGNTYDRNFSSEPGSYDASGRAVTIQSVTTPTVSGNRASFNATVTMPVNITQAQSGFTITMTGDLRTVGTFYARAPATYTWTAGGNNWSNGAAWNYGNDAPGNGYDSVLVTNGGTVDLGGASQSVINVGAANNGIVGTLQNGSLAYTGNMYVKSGAVNVNLSNSGGSGRLWVGGDGGATVYLGGTNDTTFADNQATIIGHSTTGATGTVKLTSPYALNGANQDTQVFNGTLDLNGQWDVRSRTIALNSGAGSALVNNSGDAYTPANINVSDGASIGGAGNLWLTGAVGGGGFTKTGGGTLFLYGANNYTSTNIAAGTLQIGSGGTSGSLGTGNVTNNGSLVFGSYNSATVGNAISGGGSLTLNGGAWLALTGANSYGDTIISSGILQVGNYGTSGSLGTGNVTNNDWLQFNRSDVVTVGNAISGNGNVWMDGSGTLVLTGANSYTGMTYITNGTLQVGSGYAGGSLGTGSVSNDGSLVFGSYNSATVGNAISGGGSVTLNGGGYLTLTGANSYGATIINSGTLQVGNYGTSGSLGTGNVTNNDCLQFSRSDAVTVGNAISGNGYVWMDGAGTLNLTGGNSYTGTTYVTSGAINISNAAALGTTDSGTVVYSGSALQIQNNITTNAEALYLDGTGVSDTGALRNISGTNTYTGPVTLYSTARINSDSGTLNLSGGINGGGNALTVGGSGNTTVGSIGSLASLTKDGWGMLTLTSNNSYGATNIVGGGTLQVGNGGTSGSLGSGAVTNNGGLKFNRSDAVTVGNAISGSGYVWMAGSGSLTLTDANSYTGTTYITNNGTLQVGNGGASGSLGTGSVSNGGSLVFNRSDAVTVANVIYGSGSVTKIGANTLTLTGVNTYRGATNIAGGTLQIGNGGTSGSLGTGAVTNNGALVFNRSNNVTVASTISGGGSVTKNGAGTLILNGANNYTGLTIVKAGVLELGVNAQSPILTGTGVDIQAGRIVFDYTTSDPVATILSLLAASNNGGAWNIGQFRNSTIGSTGLTFGWADDTTAKQVIVMATYAGDANLDGKTDATDLNTVLSYYNQTGATWSKGDFNGDGKTDATDLNTVLSYYNRNLASLQFASFQVATSAVPEPTVLVFLVTGGLFLGGIALRRRLRN